MVTIPLIVLSGIFGAVLTTLYFRGQISMPSNDLVLFIGPDIYVSAIYLLAKHPQAYLAQLQLLGRTDSLSLLPNRRALHADAKDLDTCEGEFALALVDLDGFKLVNDHYGHFVGDRLIKTCATMLQDIFGEDAKVYRLGGDEFAITMHGPIAGNLLEGLCRKLLILLTKPTYIDERAIVVGASVGLTRTTATEGLNSSELLRRADLAMYASKAAGKMRCTWYSEEYDRNRELLRDMDEELRKALQDNEFHLAYQPLVDAQTREIVAVEALIRWDRPDGKRIGPNVFIPIAEESGLINQIGIWVMRQALTDALHWDGIKISVNVSAAQLRNTEFPVEFGYLLEELNFPPERLELEVTETQLVIDSAVASRTLELIRGFGVRIVLDDFGTGFASFGFLRQFRFEKLKLDRSLVVDAISDEGSRAMMMASVTMARSLKMAITAEGIETEEQAALVRMAGCDQIQGWLYYKAMSAPEIGALLETDAIVIDSEAA